MYIGNCEIFHGWNNHSLYSLRKAKKFDAKTVVERNSAHPKEQIRLLKEGDIKCKGNLNQSALKRSCRELEECDYIIVPSTFVKRSFIKRGYSESKLIQIPQGVNLEKFKPNMNRTGIFRGLFVGNISERKGIHYLVEAWSDLDLEDSELLICGSIRKEMKNLAQKYKKEESISFTGYVPTLPYEKADFLVLPSLEDGFGLVVLEAMASGLPVIISENTGAKDLVKEGTQGFIVPVREPEAISERIRYFYDNPGEVERMGKNARKKAENYSWNEYQDKLVKAYEDIIK
ncbi:hypothetical protein AKJ45_00230 [candidate division MSBL1 archaeon SCGC-AAA261F19]|uniref:Glycosyl transferase family 1 domain-containing protein n=1 Tax=candidate division MSBL1 archaeon SCGC-AAA261F19 TaxID=1698275 RepID=A0A133VBU0_9EURY|nr:hypothetical protein AKJ45_00230 [candidate division MSBL1 archaeon SCGC-AAA261F19]